MCHTAIPSYMALFQNSVSHYICTDIPSETCWNNTEFSIFMEKSTTARPGRKGNNPVLRGIQKKEDYPLSIPLCIPRQNQSRVLGARSPFLVSGLLLMCLSSRGDKVLQRSVSLGAHPGAAKSSDSNLSQLLGGYGISQLEQCSQGIPLLIANS